jgi:hypothetical protein
MKIKQFAKTLALLALVRKLGVRRSLRLGMLAGETYLAVQARRRHSRRKKAGAA